MIAPEKSCLTILPHVDLMDAALGEQLCHDLRVGRVDRRRIGNRDILCMLARAKGVLAVYFQNPTLAVLKHAEARLGKEDIVET